MTTNLPSTGLLFFCDNAFAIFFFSKNHHLSDSKLQRGNETSNRSKAIESRNWMVFGEWYYIANSRNSIPISCSLYKQGQSHSDPDSMYFLCKYNKEALTRVDWYCWAASCLCLLISSLQAKHSCCRAQNSSYGYIEYVHLLIDTQRFILSKHIEDILIQAECEDHSVIGYTS